MLLTGLRLPRASRSCASGRPWTKPVPSGPSLNIAVIAFSSSSLCLTVLILVLLPVPYVQCICALNVEAGNDVT